MTTIDADIEEITAMIWTSLFDLPLTRVDEAEIDGSSLVTGMVSIDGAWNGAVMVRCSSELATTLTATMFQSDGVPEFDDVADALGELTNMVAGNVKSLLPAPCNLSLPAVAMGSDYALNVLGSTPLSTVAFTCDGHLVQVTLVQRSTDTETSGP